MPSRSASACREPRSGPSPSRTNRARGTAATTLGHRAQQVGEALLLLQTPRPHHHQVGWIGGSASRAACRACGVGGEGMSMPCGITVTRFASVMRLVTRRSRIALLLAKYLSGVRVHGAFDGEVRALGAMQAGSRATQMHGT